jgi:hypothetical protein
MQIQKKNVLMENQLNHDGGKRVMDQKRLTLQARVTEANVRLGPGNKNTNRIVLVLRNTSNEAVELDFGQQGEISLTIRVGTRGEDLVATVEEGLDIRTDIPDTWQKAKRRIMGDRVVSVFLLPDTVFQGIDEKTITLSDFECHTDPGKAVIEIDARIDGYEPYGSGPLEIEKKTLEFQILYFKADPPYIITEKDRKDFTLTWNTVEAGKVFVYKNSVPHPLLTLESRKDFENGKKYEYRDETPSLTSLYQLVATDRKDSANKKSKTLTIQVLNPGWHVIDLASYGYPALLCNMNGVKLYGIFLKEGRARLYSSRYPISVWILEHEEVPAGMETSPGVCLDGRLWLVGGSSADPRRCSNSIWSYRKEETGEGTWNKWEEQAGWMSRMGHGCVVFDHKIWILGGFGRNGETLNDVWSFDPKGGFKDHGSAPWPARCMFATAVFGGKIWIYGGATAPLANPLEDMWTSEDGEKWYPYETTPRDSGSPIGEPIGCAMEVVGKKLNLMGSFRRDTTVKAKHLVLEEGQKTWRTNELQDPWYQQDLNTFSLSAVGYKGLVFLRTLSYETQDRPAKMTLYIPPF